jgi:hypothetical protein
VSIDEELDAIHQAMDRLLDRIVDANPQLRPVEWTRYDGTTNAPGASEEAELLELGRRVAMERGYQSVLFADPADYA